MNVIFIFQYLEIFFWNTFVVLLSESDTARAILLETYRLAKPQRLGKTLSQGVILALAGLAIGFLFGFMRTILQ